MVHRGESIADAMGWTLADLSWVSNDDSHAIGTLWFVAGKGRRWIVETGVQITADRCMGGGIVTDTALDTDRRCPGRFIREGPQTRRAHADRVCIAKRTGR